MENKQLTKTEVVQVTINLLSNINVPAVLSESIGIPVLNAIKNLGILKSMIEMEEEQKAQDTSEYFAEETEEEEGVAENEREADV